MFYFGLSGILAALYPAPCGTSPIIMFNLGVPISADELCDTPGALHKGYRPRLLQAHSVYAPTWQNIMEVVCQIKGTLYVAQIRR